MSNIGRIINEINGTAVFVPGSNIDTDRIVPARFLRCVTFDGLGETLFYDVRFEENGEEKDHPLNDSRFKGSSIMLAEDNFGCGSSREHAPQAIYRYGIKAIIAESFAEIFFGNCSILGLPCLIMEKKDIQEISNKIENNPKLEVLITIESKTVTIGEKRYSFEIPDNVKSSFLSGKYDPLIELSEGCDLSKARLKKLSYS